jgi:hypothetical protein
VVSTGKEALKRLAQAGDIDALLIDAGIPDPQLPYLLGQLLSDRDSSGLPIVITAPASQVERLQRQFERYRNVRVTETSASGSGLKRELAARITAASGRPLGDVERKDFAARALEWLARLARGELSGYDLRPATPAILQSLQSKELAGLAVEAAGHLAGREPQLALASAVLSTSLPEPLRSAAAIELSRHIQHYGLALTSTQVQELEKLFDSATDARLKTHVALVLGSMHPDAHRTGERLQRYVPAIAAPAKAAAPAPAPKKEKEAEPSSGTE